MGNVIHLMARRLATHGVVTEQDAIALVEFFVERMNGWSIVISVDPARDRIDFRTRRSREANDFERDFWLNSPGSSTLIATVQSGIELADLWPEAFRPVLLFRLHHSVPRSVNEPLSDHRRQQRRDLKHPAWPHWLDAYAAPATEEDHPALPPRSDLFLAWKESAASIKGGGAT